MKIKLAIGIPNTGVIKSQTVFALCRMLKDFPYDYKVIFQEGSVLHAIRENIVKVALKENCTHLLFLDSDMVFEADAVIKLLKRKKDVIGVSYNKRKFPSESTMVFFNQRDMQKKITTCESVATGFMLIDLKVFKKLPHPWFFWESDDQGGVITGEDFWFCRLAREAGFKVWVDLSVTVKHIGDYAY